MKIQFKKYFYKFLQEIYAQEDPPRSTDILRLQIIGLVIFIPWYLLTLPGTIIYRLDETNKYYPADLEDRFLHSFLGWLCVFGLIFIVAMIVALWSLLWRLSLLLLVIVGLLMLNNKFKKPIHHDF